MLISSFTLSMLFMKMSHPLSMGGILLTQTILIALASGFIYPNFWFSYILFLIMVGGMLVLFIYMTSIASNEKFSMPKNFILFPILSVSSTIFTTLILDKFLNFQINSFLMSFSQSFFLSNTCLNKYFNSPNVYILVFLIIYLLITLIVIVKITGKPKGTLHQK